MNYLALVQALRTETIDAGSGPTTVVGQTGENARLCKWVKDAHDEIQVERDDWLWMRGAFTVPTVANTDTYAYGACTDTATGVAISRFARWYDGYDSSGFPYFSAYLSSTGVGGEYPLLPIPWDAFHRLYKLGTQNNNQPFHVSIDPAMNIVLGPKPDDVYVVRGSYQRSPISLAADADVPEMPARFHNLIVYEAMSKYGGNRVAPEAMLRANSEGGRLRAMLELSQLPQMAMGGALA